MDKSKEYIKMCDCEEMQSFRGRRWEHPLLKGKKVGNIKEGDYYYNGFNVKPHFPTDPLNQEIHVWLPRQDQLQEMMKENPYDLLDNLFDFCNDFDYYPYISMCGSAIDGWEQNDYTKQFNSMEMLWLTFVMKEKFNKAWKDGKWIIQNIPD